jgi:hypothetical protein
MDHLPCFYIDFVDFYRIKLSRPDDRAQSEYISGSQNNAILPVHQQIHPLTLHVLVVRQPGRE